MANWIDLNPIHTRKLPIIYLHCGCRAATFQRKDGHYEIQKAQLHRDSCKLSFWEKVIATDYPYKLIVKRDPCSYCNELGGTIDHIVPQSADGSNAWNNLTGACIKCNCKKGSKGLLQFLMEIHDNRRKNSNLDMVHA